ncbi:MAG: prolyl oligopeptidase family serine peptidase [Planctomycetota bacterium]|nr:prolyl oligopeptidase family serine peptidase [Planctomycetota bacterium]
MKSPFARLLAVALVFAFAGSVLAQPLEYPNTKKVNQIDEFHGVKVEDPYRWLEDLDSPATKAWVEAQNKVTFGYLEKIPARERLKSRLTELWDYAKFGIPLREGKRYFFKKNDGLQNQSVLYMMDSLESSPRAVLDPNTFSDDGTRALNTYAVSRNGKFIAYGISDGGSDWQTYRVRDIETGKDTDDVVEWVKFSTASWSGNSKGFFYSRYDAPTGDKLEQANYFQKLYYHRLGTPQAADTLIYERPDEKDWGFGGDVTDDGRLLIITVWKGTERKYRIYYKDLTQPDSPVVKLLDDFDAEYAFIDNDGPVLWFRTDLDAPRGRVIAVDTRPYAPTKIREVIREGKETLRGVDLVNDTFVCSYLKDAKTLIRLFNFQGKQVGDVTLPGIGTARGFAGKRREKETFYSFQSYSRPPTIYRYDMATGKSTIFRQPKANFSPDDYESKQVFYKSKDGTRIPMFITHKKGLKLNGNNPTYLYGYGGFDIAITPRFRVGTLAWMEMGGVHAVANIRGGGEYGKEWHNAGKLLKKQNCFDDFIAAAEWLIANKYTRTEKLAIGGGSNGGLLVGACITQRPDLCAAALPAVGVLDMLRFQHFTIGHAWRSDYGYVEKEDQFKALHAYSPLHNIREGTSYPATLITTGDHDDRVVPSHSFKFASALQASHKGDAPVIIRIETRAGHGAGKPTWMTIEEQADRWAFLVRNLGIEDAAVPR